MRNEDLLHAPETQEIAPSSGQYPIPSSTNYEQRHAQFGELSAEEAQAMAEKQYEPEAITPSVELDPIRIGHNLIVTRKFVLNQRNYNPN